MWRSVYDMITISVEDFIDHPGKHLPIAIRVDAGSVPASQGDVSVVEDVTISGEGFQPGVKVKLGGTELTGVHAEGDSDSVLAATVPAGMEVGSYDLFVINIDGTSASLMQAFEVLARAEIPKSDSGCDCELAADGMTRVFRLESKEHGVNAVFRFPCGHDQHAVIPIARENPVEANYRMYQLCLEEWNEKRKPFPNSLFDDLPLKTLDWLDAEFAARMPGPEMQHEVICDLCGTRNPMNLEMSDFLFPRPQPGARRKSGRR